MTREEAVQYLHKLYMMSDITDEYGDMDDTEPYETAIDMAVEALKFRGAYEIAVKAANKAFENKWTQWVEWIPCSERLPDVHEFVNTHGYSLSSDYMLISIRFGEHNTKHTVTIGRYMQGDPKWKWKLLHGNLYGIVDAWMPLPKPYQEDNQ